MVGFDEVGGGYHQVSFAQTDPVILELNRLHNELKDKNRELIDAKNEIKALRATEALKDRALEELNNNLDGLDDNLRVSEDLLEQKNLEIKKLISEKKDAMAAQFAAEATLRRVYANQKDDDAIPIESFIAPLEAENKMYQNEIAALQEDKKALERLTKSKEAALLEAEKILKSALERALVVEDVQNENFDLKRQIEICQEENRILDKTNRQKVSEVEKLSHSIQELEEAILANGAAANMIRDCKRQISELNEEKRMLERELARAKVSANRVATVVSKEWKDDNEKVMPVKQWIEERKLLQAEMQRLRDKLAVTERTAKAEALLKDKLSLRLKTLEEGLKHINPIVSSDSNTTCLSSESNQILSFLATSAQPRKRSSSQPRGSTIGRSPPLQNPNADNQITNPAARELWRVNSLKKKFASGEAMLKKSLWVSKSKVTGNGEKENAEMTANTDVKIGKFTDTEMPLSEENKTKADDNEVKETEGNAKSEGKDVVSGFLYDRLQKEVINLRKKCEAKESTLNAKDDEIKMLLRRIEALTKSIEIESRKSKREAAAREKEAVLPRLDDNKKNKNVKLTSSRRVVRT